MLNVQFGFSQWNLQAFVHRLPYPRLLLNNFSEIHISQGLDWASPFLSDWFLLFLHDHDVFKKFQVTIASGFLSYWDSTAFANATLRCEFIFCQLTLYLPGVPKITIQGNPQISSCKILKNKWYHYYYHYGTIMVPLWYHYYHGKVLLKSFYLNGHTVGFRPQTQKL